MIVITFLAASIVASKIISAPLELVSLSVIKPSTLASVISESSVFLTASSNVIVIFEFTTIPVVPLIGLKVTVGVVVLLKISNPVLKVYS